MKITFLSQVFTNQGLCAQLFYDTNFRTTINLDLLHCRKRNHHISSTFINKALGQP